jgi:glycosyltransferase involved in cell wall biosynthesis
MPSPRRILYILPTWFIFHHGFRGQLAYLKSKGFEIDVAGEDDPRADEAALREGVRYHKIDISSRPYLIFRNFLTILRLIRLIRVNRYTILFCTTKMAGLMGVIVGKITGLHSVIYAVLGIFSKNMSDAKRRIFPIVEKCICNASDYVLFISKSNLDYFLAKKICHKQKAVLYGSGSINGIDLDHFKSTNLILEESKGLRRSIGIDDNAFLFGFVGRLVKEKGIRELAEAWTMLCHHVNEIFLIIMSPPEIDPSIASAIASLRRDSKVKFLGFLEDPAIGYGMMNCLLFPTYGEGLGNVILEAAAMEIPAIASRVIGCVDAVVHEKTGLLIEPRNPHALYLAMNRVVKDKSIINTWGTNARERCILLFDQQLIWQEYERFYDGLLNKAKHPENNHAHYA